MLAFGVWIQEFYNRTGLYSALGNNTPVLHEMLVHMAPPRATRACQLN